MKRVAFILILVCLATGLFAFLPSSLSRQGNPVLYDRLMPKAKANIKQVPASHRKEYKKLLKQYDDILMAYLIAYESNATLSSADPDDIFSNYRELRLYLDKEGLHYLPEIFLSYVAKQSVSDEPLTAYRKAMLDDGLRDVLDNNSDILQRYRATASWCVEKLKFQQTSGRDQSPLDITQKSLVGRCEEMQILFVAAARTVGIPARPASTPWWAHIDNNHAWAEVYLNGEWAYTGDMDAAYHPNQTWFSGLIDKTVLILADGSMPTPQDEILGEGDYDVLINSTRNYAKERTREIQVSVTDESSLAVDKAIVSVLVFNWGSLRTLSSLVTDPEGSLKFSAGRGAFYLSAYKDGKQALVLVESDTLSTMRVQLKLSEAALPAQNAMLHYPGNPMDWKQAPQSYQDDIAARKQIWQDQVDRWQNLASEIAEGDSLNAALLVAARGNYPQMQLFLDKHAPLQSDFAAFLLADDPKYLWQADSEQLEALYNHYLAHPRDADYPAQVYQPTMFYEELSRPFGAKGNRQLYPSSFRVKGADDAAKLQRVAKAIRKKYKINPQKALQGLLPLHIATQQKYLTSYQYRMMCIAALRANGIAAEYTRIPDQILVYIDGDWHYYDPIKQAFAEQKEALSGQSLKLEIVDEEGLPIQITEEQLSLTRLVSGQFYSLNNRFEYLGNGKYQSMITDADLYLQFGYRVSDSQTALQIVPVKDLDLSQSLRIIADQYPRTWQEADESILSLFDDEILEQASLILLGNYDQENSLRILERIKDQPYRFFGYASSPAQLPHYAVLPAWQKLIAENTANQHRSITLTKVDGRWLYYEGFWEKLPQ
jgi:hypothetical protein